MLLGPVHSPPSLHSSNFSKLRRFSLDRVANQGERSPIKKGGSTHHVRVSVKRLHSCQQLLVVSQTDQDLRVVPNTLLQNRQRTLRDLLLLQLLDLTLIHIRLGHILELTSNGNRVSCNGRSNTARTEPTSFWRPFCMVRSDYGQ